MDQLPIPVVPVPVDRVPMAYTPFRFNFPAPQPLPPVTDPMPDVMRQYEQEVTKQQLKQKDAENRHSPRKHGLISGITHMVSDLSGQIQKGLYEAATEVDKAIRSSNFETAQKNFYNCFRMPYECLWREYGCQIVNGNILIVGNMYISDHYVGFCGDKKVHGHDKLQRLVFLIPMKNIVSIQKGVCLKAVDSEHPPQIILSNPGVKSDALILYTKDGSMHQFYGFWNIKHTFNVIDHAWRAAWLDASPPNYPIPLGQVMPPFAPIERKNRPGLAQHNNPQSHTTYNQPYLSPSHTTYNSYPPPGQTYPSASAPPHGY